MDYKAAVVSSENDYITTSSLLKRMHYHLEVLGRISPGTEATPDVIGQMAHLPEVQKIYRINELIFSTGSISYKEMMRQMERCAPYPYYKIHTSGSEALVGSNNSRHHAEEFSLDKRYRIGAADARRNKRIVDIGIATMSLLLYPICLLWVKEKSGFFSNIWNVLSGKKTWVGYEGIASSYALPKIKPAVLPPHTIIDNYIPDRYNYDRLAAQYASNYSLLDDLRIIWVNFKFLGQKKS
jgi:O-antigen biosynthesis protein